MSGTRNVSVGGAVILSLVLLGLTSCPPPVSSPPAPGSTTVQVYRGATEITSSTGYNYGSCIALSSTVVTFTVKNNTSSTVNLNATTPFAVAGTDAVDFHLMAVSATRVLVPGATAAFDVWFIPSKTSAESATLTVNCNSGNVSLPLHGTGASSGTTFTIKCVTTDTQVNRNDTVVFPTMSTLNGNLVTYTFTITNTGTAPLGIPTIGPTVTVTPDTDTEFVSTLPPMGPALAAGDTSLPFGVMVFYTNKGVQSYTDTVTVHTSSTDPAYATFTFKVTGIQTLPTNTYLLSPSLSMTTTPAVCTGGSYSLNSGTNPFAENAAVVFIGGNPPHGTLLNTVYYVTGSGTSALSIFPLAGGASYACAVNSDYGTTTVYAMDWTFVHLGTVTPAANGQITVTNHGLSVGDTVYIAADDGSPNLTSGAYVVATAPDANTFTLQGITLTTSDSFNFLAKVGNTPGAVPLVGMAAAALTAPP